MIKLTVFLFLFFLLISASFVQAKDESGQNANTSGQTQQKTQKQAAVLVITTASQKGYQHQVNTQNQGQAQQIQNQEQLSISPTGAGNQVRNQNEVNIQNQGQGEGLQQRNQNGVQNMSTVAQKVQQLLQVRTTGGIGDQVRQVAQEQISAQAQIQEQLNRFESKGKFARFLTGTDYRAVKNLKQQTEQNQLRIEQLRELQNQLTNQSDIIAVQETIQALTSENTSLQERINSEEQTKSMFGWLFGFFNR